MPSSMSSSWTSWSAVSARMAAGGMEVVATSPSSLARANIGSMAESAVDSSFTDSLR